MKFNIPLSGKTLLTFMRNCGYAPQDSKDGQLRFHRMISGRPYPRFHVYCTLSADEKTAFFDLHLDQKQPSYQGSRAHSGEYEGPLLEQETERIQKSSERVT